MPDLGKESSWIFTFPRSIQIGAEDFYGDKAGLFEAFDGDYFTYKLDVTGPVLVLDEDKNNPGHIMLNNNTGEPISASIYRDGKLLSTQTEILDEQTVSFNFNEEIYFGIYSSGELNEGELVDFVNFSYAVKFDFSHLNSATVTVTGSSWDGFVIEMTEE